MIYFDNAATTFRKPQKVISECIKAMNEYGANPGRSGHKLSMTADEKVFETREKLAHFFNCPGPEKVVFTKNCTEALNTALKGVLYEKRKRQRGITPHVIATVLDHNSVLRPLHKCYTRGLCTYSVSEVDENSPERTLRLIKSHINRNTRIIICTHASNSFGVCLPIEEIGRLCKERNLIFILDAAQSAGVLPIDMQKLGVDILCAPGHKGLMGPFGTGVMLLGRDINIETILEGGTGSASSSLTQPDFLPDKLEAGTLNLSGIAGLCAGIDFLSERGVLSNYLEEMRLFRRLYEAMKSIPKVILYTPYPEDFRCVPVLSFNIQGMSPSEVAKKLSDRDIFCRSGFSCAYPSHKHFGTDSEGTVRASLSVFNTEAEVNIFASVVRKLCEN